MKIKCLSSMRRPLELWPDRLGKVEIRNSLDSLLLTFELIQFISAENRKILNEQYAEKMLIYLLLCDHDETKTCAAQALSVMAESTYSQDAIRNYGKIC